MIRIIRDDSFDLEYHLKRPLMRHAAAFLSGILAGSFAFMIYADWAPHWVLWVLFGGYRVCAMIFTVASVYLLSDMLDRAFGRAKKRWGK